MATLNEKRAPTFAEQDVLMPNFVQLVTLNEKRAPTFAEQDVLMPNFVQPLHFIDSASPFLLEKSNLKILVFRVFFSS